MSARADTDADALGGALMIEVCTCPACEAWQHSVRELERERCRGVPEGRDGGPDTPASTARRRDVLDRATDPRVRR